MAISFIGKSEASGGGTPAFPAGVTAGDFVIGFLYHDNSATLPATPSGYTTAPGQATAGNSQAHRIIGKFIAAGEAPPTINGYTSIIWHAYRGVNKTSPFGPTASGASATNTTQVTYPAITMTATDGTSWVIGFVGIRIATQAVETPPAGMVNRSNTINGTSGETAAHDTDGPVAAWPQKAGSGTGSRWRTGAFELMAEPDAAAAGTAAGASTVAATGTSTAAGTGTASGAGIASAAGGSIRTSAGTAGGISTAQGVGSSGATGTGSAAGAGTASGAANGNVTIVAAGAAAGSSAAIGTGGSIRAAAGMASGSSDALAVGRSLNGATGAASGAGLAVAVGSALSRAAGVAGGMSVAQAFADAANENVEVSPADIIRGRSWDRMFGGQVQPRAIGGYERTRIVR